MFCVFDTSCWENPAPSKPCLPHHEVPYLPRLDSQNPSPGPGEPAAGQQPVAATLLTSVFGNAREMQRHRSPEQGSQLPQVAQPGLLGGDRALWKLGSSSPQSQPCKAASSKPSKIPHCQHAAPSKGLAPRWCLARTSPGCCSLRHRLCWGRLELREAKRKVGLKRLRHRG